MNKKELEELVEKVKQRFLNLNGKEGKDIPPEREFVEKENEMHGMSVQKQKMSQSDADKLASLAMLIGDTKIFFHGGQGGEPEKFEVALHLLKSGYKDNRYIDFIIDYLLKPNTIKEYQSKSLQKKAVRASIVERILNSPEDKRASWLANMMCQDENHQYTSLLAKELSKPRHAIVDAARDKVKSMKKSVKSKVSGLFDGNKVANKVADEKNKEEKEEATTGMRNLKAEWIRLGKPKPEPKTQSPRNK